MTVRKRYRRAFYDAMGYSIVDGKKPDKGNWPLFLMLLGLLLVAGLLEGQAPKPLTGEETMREEGRL